MKVAEFTTPLKAPFVANYRLPHSDTDQLRCILFKRSLPRQLWCLKCHPSVPPVLFVVSSCSWVLCDTTASNSFFNSYLPFILSRLLKASRGFLELFEMIAVTLYILSFKPLQNLCSQFMLTVKRRLFCLVIMETFHRSSIGWWFLFFQWVE